MKIRKLDKRIEDRRTGFRSIRIGGAQIQWLDNELLEAEKAGETVVVYAHHSLESMNNTVGGGSVHCGLIEQGGACAQQESLEALFYRSPSVVAYVAGHEHNNRIDPRQEDGGEGNFWEVVLASEVDWPQQGGMVEIFNNNDGTFSIFRTILDQAGKPDPGDNPDLDNPWTRTLTLASISREISFNEPQASMGGAGTLADRNVELIVTR